MADVPIDEARRLTAIDSVQVEVSAWRDANLLNGVVVHCLALGMPIIASRPLGGAARTRRVESDPVLAAVARRHGATPAEIALAWGRSPQDVLFARRAWGFLTALRTRSSRRPREAAPRFLI